MVSLAAPDDPVANNIYTEHDISTNNPSYEDTHDLTVPESPNSSKARPTYVSEYDVNLAGMHVADALHFRNVLFRSDRLTCYQLYQDKITRTIFVVFPILLLCLALIEEPAVVGLNVHWQVAISLELICLVAYTCRVLHLAYCINRRDFWMDVKNCVAIAAIFVTLVDVLVWFVLKVSQGRTIIRFSRVLRPLLIVNLSDNRTLRKLLRVIKRTVIDVLSVLILIFLFIGIFAMMATKFFERRTILDPHGDKYLDNFFDSYWNLYVFMTTANSPDIGLPAFKDENAFFFFFAPFSVITTFVLMNILLAVVYKHYRLHLLEEVKVDISICQNNLQKAFNLLKDPKTDCIGSHVWLKSYQTLGCPDVLQKLYWEYLVQNPDDPGIGLQSFYKITELLSSDIKVVFGRRTWLENNIPWLYNSTISCYLRFSVEHIAFTIIYDILIFANAVALSIKTAPAFLESTFLVLFNIEIALKLYTFGPKRFSSSAWNVYDCLVIWSASIFSLILGVEKLTDSKNTELSLVFFDMVLTLRVLRLIKLLTSIPQLNLIISTIMQIIPSMGSYALLLLLFFYSYAIVGMEMFAGKIIPTPLNSSIANCGNDLLAGSQFVEENYCIMTFNSVWYSMVVLWTLTLVNQWHILADGFVRVTNKWSRLYFLSFHVLVVLIILNIFLAFVIEAFMLQIELDKKRSKSIDKHMDVKGVHARKESHQSNQPKWYRKPSLIHAIVDEEDDPDRICIGNTTVTERIRYRRQKTAKSYNQLLLEMFQADIQKAGASQVSKDLSTELGDLPEEDGFGQEDVVESEVSVGSLQDLDII